MLKELLNLKLLLKASLCAGTIWFLGVIVFIALS
jgi:hypothetical protein